MSASRAVRVITDVAAVDKAFDYLVTPETAHVGIGDRVRIDFNNRVVRGWVLEDVPVSEGLKPLSKWLGFGPPAALLDLVQWASERWYSPVARFLISTSPKRQIASLPQAPAPRHLSESLRDGIDQVAPGLYQVAPTTDPLPMILSAYEQTCDAEGSLLVLVPTESWAQRLRGRLEQRGIAVASGDQEWDRMRAGWPVIVGARGTALAPTPKICGAVLIDADDEAYRSEGAPTWDAFTMVRERCTRDQAPFWATSSVPSPDLLSSGAVVLTANVTSGWPRIEVIDRRTSDPRDGVLSQEVLLQAHRALAGSEGVAVCVVLQRLGTGRLFACKKCGELARCRICNQGEEEVGSHLSCPSRHELRENFCLSCGATNLKRVRSGVTTLARDVSAQLSQPVSEVTGQSELDGPLHRVVVGTEAVWQRVRRCALVIFVDFDQYLLAPRESARRSALVAVAKAGRLTGARTEGRGAVIVQTRRGEDEVLSALLTGDVTNIVTEDNESAKLLQIPPYCAQAIVKGEGAESFCGQLREAGLQVYPTNDEFIVRASTQEELSRVLRSSTRPVEKLRVAVR